MRFSFVFQKIAMTVKSCTNSHKYNLFQMDVDVAKGDGFRTYYITKIEELQLIVADKSQNLRRLQAQRNELNAKGNQL